MGVGDQVEDGPEKGGTSCVGVGGASAVATSALPGGGGASAGL